MSETIDQRYLPLIFDSSPMGIFTVDAEGRITSFNSMAEQMTGYSREQAVGRRCFDVLRADICQGDCPLKRSVRTRQNLAEREVTILTREGSERPIAVSTAALLDDRGEVVGGVEMFRDLTTIAELRKQLKGSFVFEDIVSKNAEMHAILERLPLYAASDSTILVEGASGTGKELVARALHNLGKRQDKPFVAINCAALPDTLLESELFGYRKGAFTEAKTDKPGRFELAEGGTIFLDEIGEISTAMQVKLLRVLQERLVEPLGGTRSVPIDVRVIAATNKHLAAEVAAGRFRDDLFFRLNVIRVELPPLARRREDVPLLVEHFISRFNAVQGKHIRQVSERAMAALLAAPYAGNVRELENSIEHAFVLCQGDTLQLRHLPPDYESYLPEQMDVGDSFRTDSGTPLEAAEAQTIRHVLDECNGNRSLAAEKLGLSRTTLWRKMRRFGL